MSESVLKRITKSLGIRFPIAELSRELDYSKGVVSQYYNDKKEMSENFKELLENRYRIRVQDFENNPAHKIKNLSVVESRANTPATSDEHEKIKNCLSENYPNFFNFIKTIYYTGARPKELLSVKLEMINLRHREIILPAEITKVGKTDRIIVIDDGLLEVLQEMEIDKYPKDFYLFGSFRISGRGNVGKHLDFIPGPTPLKRDTATKRWKKIVKDGLAIDVNMYSYKHKGGNDKLRAGVDLDSIRNQYGHSNKKMTKVYVKEITGYYKDDIIRNSTEF